MHIGRSPLPCGVCGQGADGGGDLVTFIRYYGANSPYTMNIPSYMVIQQLRVDEGQVFLNLVNHHGVSFLRLLILRTS